MSFNPLVSVLVPTRNSGATIRDLLQSILDQTYKNIETIVVDNDSSDLTCEISLQFTSNVYTMGPERSAQRNYAAKKSSGDILIVLDSDMILTPTVVEDVVQKFAASEKTISIVIPEKSFGTGFWTRCKILERSFYNGIRWMEAARAFKRQMFFEVGGYDENNTGTEDYDLPHRLEEMYGRDSTDRVAANILHNEGRLKLIDTCRKKFYYARNLDVYSNKEANKEGFIKQASPIRRMALFFNSPSKLFADPIVGIGMIYMKLFEMVFGAAGYLLRKRPSKIQKSLYR